MADFKDIHFWNLIIFTYILIWIWSEDTYPKGKLHVDPLKATDYTLVECWENMSNKLVYTFWSLSRICHISQVLKYTCGVNSSSLQNKKKLKRHNKLWNSWWKKYRKAGLNVTNIYPFTTSVTSSLSFYHLSITNRTWKCTRVFFYILIINVWLLLPNFLYQWYFKIKANEH